MGWPPKVGDVLPGAEDAWCEQIKLVDWVLADRGHGSEWERVFLVTRDDWERLGEQLVAAIAHAPPIQVIRDRGDEGLVCGVEVDVTFGERTARVTLSWHYETEGAAPRLVTAYPTL